jgi:hypothetical protein
MANFNANNHRIRKNPMLHQGEHHMKRLLSSLKVLTLLAAIMIPTAATVSAQTIDGCDDWIVITTPRGSTVCLIDDADDEWCYYSCYAA